MDIKFFKENNRAKNINKSYKYYEYMFKIRLNYYDKVPEDY